MNRIQDRLLRRIALFCKEAEISESLFGMITVNDNKLCDRLRHGNITLATLDRVNAFFEEQQLLARRRAFRADQRAEVQRLLDLAKRRKPEDRQLSA